MNKLNKKAYSLIKNVTDYLPLILEIAFSLGVFYISAKIINHIFNYDKYSMISPDSIIYKILFLRNGMFIIPSIIMLIIAILFIVFISKKAVLYIIKALILDIILTMFVVKFITVFGFIPLRDMDWLIILALMLTWGLPLGLAAYVEHKQKYGLLKNLFLFIGIALIVFLPSLIQYNFARKQIFYSIAGALSIYIIISYISALTYAIRIDTEYDSSIGTALFVNAILPIFLLVLLGIGLFSIILIILKLPLHLFTDSRIAYIWLSQVQTFELGLAPIYVVFDYVRNFFKFNNLSQFISSISFLTLIFTLLLASPTSVLDLMVENISFIRMGIGGIFILAYIIGFQSIISSIIRLVIAVAIFLLVYLYYKMLSRKNKTG